MVMIGRDEKYFFTSNFFAHHLNNDRENFPDINRGNYHEHYERISHEGHDSESSTEPESTSITEVELCRLDIEPEKCSE